MAGLILLPISLAISAFSEHESGDLQHAASWNEHEVARWLSTLQLERYSDAFVASNIDGEALIELSEQNLLELGVDSAAHRKLLLHAALELQKPTSQPTELGSHACSHARCNATDRARSTRPKPLTDQQLRQFVSDGFVFLEPDAGEFGECCAQCETTHERAYRSALDLFTKSGLQSSAGIGNNIFPAIPWLHDILTSRTVVGALESVLGPDYVMHAMRTMHGPSDTAAGHHHPLGGQGWHKDS
jgi:hypothetical protein